MEQKFNPNLIQIKTISLKTAKLIVLRYHYMKTFPAGAHIAFSINYPGYTGPMGVAVFGKSISTDKKCKLFGIEPINIIEMQRLWISDKLGANAESKTLSKIMAIFKNYLPNLKVVWTYAGGCKNDCGIVYQSSGFMYLGSEKCDDFYLTANGEYKNLINVMRFGKAPKHLKDKNEIAKYLFGPGELIKSNRYFYFYPLSKALRRKMAEKCKPFPKYSEHFRKDQKWVT